MTTLLWKDWRLNSTVTRTLLICSLVIPVIIFVARAANDGLENTVRADDIAVVLAISAAASLGLGVILSAAYAGSAFARERRDRSAEFLNTLPINRRWVVLSKAIITAALCSIPWLLSAMVLTGADFAVSRSNPALPAEIVHADLALNGLIQPAWWIFQVQLMLIGIAWLLSSLLRSEVAAAGVALLLTILLGIGYMMYRQRLEYSQLVQGHAEHQANLVATITLLTLGLGGLIAGTIIALKRTSP